MIVHAPPPATPTTPTTPTWERLVALEPRLAPLLAEARRPTTLCWTCRWYGRPGLPGLKRRLSELVGWWSKHPDSVLRSAVAYEVAYDRVLDAVPNRPRCSACGVR